MNMGSRSQVQALIKRGQVSVNGVIVTTPKQQVEEKTAKIICGGVPCRRYRPYVYFLMNKPSGVVSATHDARDKTVLDLLKETLSAQYGKELRGIPIEDIFPAGRLDKDAVGLMLLTNDGGLAHRLLSPDKHVPKKYYVELDKPLDEEKAALLTAGLDIGEKKKTKPAEVEILTPQSCYLTISEGKYHQVKRMFGAVGLTVLYLKRISLGNLTLEEGFLEGSVRELSEKEVESIC